MLSKLLSSALIALTCSQAVAASQYVVVVPVPGLTATKPAVQLTLHSAVLPDAITGKPYSHDFKPYLQITGDADAQNTQATWSGATLPRGLALTSGGVLAGSPEQLALQGANFIVTAKYKGQSGEQVYTLRIGYETLDVLKVAAGYNHACAVTVGGGVKCWGANGLGQLGNGTTTGSNLPVQVAGLTSGVTAIAASGGHTCAIQGATVLCWGQNSSGQLGNGNTSNSSVPVVATAAGSARALTTGAYHTCAVTTDGGIQCFGYGAGTFGFASGVTAVASANYHTCVIHQGAAKCWGPNDSGQLGGGHNNATWDVLQVQGLTSGVISIAAGYSHSCATKADGTVWCWGSNESGQVGNLGGQPAFAPVQVPGITGASQVAANSSYSCAVATGGVYCWGVYPGRSGGSAPSRLSGFEGNSSLTAGGTFLCGVGGDTAKCYGINDAGQLGDGTLLTAEVPVPVRK